MIQGWTILVKVMSACIQAKSFRELIDSSKQGPIMLLLIQGVRMRISNSLMHCTKGKFLPLIALVGLKHLLSQSHGSFYFLTKLN